MLFKRKNFSLTQKANSYSSSFIVNYNNEIVNQNIAFGPKEPAINTVKDLFSFLKNGLKQDTKSLIMATYRLGEFLCAIPDEAFADDQIHNFANTLYHGMLSVHNDIFEAYLVVMLRRFDLDVKVDRVTHVSVTEDENLPLKAFAYAVDGFRRLYPQAEIVGILDSVRRVVGGTKK